MKRITTNLAFRLMLLGIASFWIVYLAFGQNASIEIASGLLLGACLFLGLSWTPAASIGLTSGTNSGAAVLALGLCTTGLFGAGRQIWTLVYRLHERPQAMLDHWSYPFIIWSVFWAVSIVLVAPGTEKGDIPATNKIYLLAAGAIGILAAGIAIGMSLEQTVR